MWQGDHGAPVLPAGTELGEQQLSEGLGETQPGKFRRHSGLPRSLLSLMKRRGKFKCVTPSNHGPVTFKLPIKRQN